MDYGRRKIGITFVVEGIFSGNFQNLFSIRLWNNIFQYVASVSKICFYEFSNLIFLF